jgi:hypothetical protein
VQIVIVAGVTTTAGTGFTITVTVVKLVQPAAVVPVMVYVVVAVGVAVTVAPLVALNPVAGVHAYVLAPLAVRLVEAPAQMAGAAGVTEMVGTGFMITVTVVVPVQPLAVVPLTV